MHQNPGANPYHQIKAPNAFNRAAVNGISAKPSNTFGFQSSFFSKPDTFTALNQANRFASGESQPNNEINLKKRISNPAEPLPSVNLTWMEILRQRLRGWSQSLPNAERPIGIRQLQQ